MKNNKQEDHCFETFEYILKQGENISFGGIQYATIESKENPKESLYCIKGDELYDKLTDTFQKFKVYKWNQYVNNGAGFKRITRLMLENKSIICLQQLRLAGAFGCAPGLGHGVNDGEKFLPILNVGDSEYLALPMNLHDGTDSLHDVYFKLEGEDHQDILAITKFGLETGFDKKMKCVEISINHFIKVLQDLSIYDKGTKIFYKNNLP